MNCSDTYPDRKIIEVSFPKGSLTQTFKMTWLQLAQSRSHKTEKTSQWIFKETDKALLSKETPVQASDWKGAKNNWNVYISVKLW